MKNYFKNLSLLILGLLLITCQNENDDLKENTGLIDHNEEKFIGSIMIDNVKIDYQSIAKDELNFEIKIGINKQVLTASVDFERENLEIDGLNAEIKESEKLALLSFGQKVADYLLSTKNGDINMTEYSLLSLAEYWGKAPKNYIYYKRSIKGLTDGTLIKSRNEGVTCIRKNTYVNAEYDDARGNRSDRVKVGSKPRNNYGCMGRCGADCGRWWVPSAWTKDCMDHDQCSNVNNASGGSGDRNCGDEFDEAADDYVFGVIRGCRG